MLLLLYSCCCGWRKCQQIPHPATRCHVRKAFAATINVFLIKYAHTHLHRFCKKHCSNIANYLVDALIKAENACDQLRWAELVRVLAFSVKWKIVRKEIKKLANHKSGSSNLPQQQQPCGNVRAVTVPVTGRSGRIGIRRVCQSARQAANSLQPTSFALSQHSTLTWHAETRQQKSHWVSRNPLGALQKRHKGIGAALK